MLYLNSQIVHQSVGWQSGMCKGTLLVRCLGLMTEKPIDRGRGGAGGGREEKKTKKMFTIVAMVTYSPGQDHSE